MRQGVCLVLENEYLLAATIQNLCKLEKLTHSSGDACLTTNELACAGLGLESGTVRPPISSKVCGPKLTRPVHLPALLGRKMARFSRTVLEINFETTLMRGELYRSE